MAIPSPNIAPSDYSAGAINLQVSSDWFGIIQGILPVLEDRSYWDVSDSEFTQIKEWLLELYDMANNATIIQDIRVNPNTRQLQVQQNDTWQNIGYVQPDCDCPANPTVLNYVPGVDPDTGIDNACRVAGNLYPWVRAKIFDTVQVLELTGNSISVIDNIALLTGVGYVIADQITDAIDELIEFTVSALEVAYDTDMDERLTCLFYQAAKYPALEFKDKILDLVRNDGLPPAVLISMTSFLGLLSNDTMAERVMIASQFSTDISCSALCNIPWVHYELDNVPFTGQIELGSLTADNLIDGEDRFGTSGVLIGYNAWFDYVFNQDVEIKEVQITRAIIAAPEGGLTRLFCFDAGGTEIFNQLLSFNGVNNTVRTENFAINLTNVRRIYIRCSTNQTTPNTVDMKISKVRISGEGFNPFE